MEEVWRIVISEANAVIAVFTVALVVTTVVYTMVTIRLLKQSREAFLVDMIIRIMQPYWMGLKDILKEGEFTESLATVLKRNFHKGMSLALMKVNRKLGREYAELSAIVYDQALESLLERHKLEKERKENKTT